MKGSKRGEKMGKNRKLMNIGVSPLLCVFVCTSPSVVVVVVGGRTGGAHLCLPAAACVPSMLITGVRSVAYLNSLSFFSPSHSLSLSLLFVSFCFYLICLFLCVCYVCAFVFLLFSFFSVIRHANIIFIHIST